MQLVTCNEFYDAESLFVLFTITHVPKKLNLIIHGVVCNSLD